MKLNNSNDKNELIDRLVALDGRIVYHFVDADCIQYSDEMDSPLLEISQVSPPDKDGWVTWRYHFIESDEWFDHTENLKYIQEDKERLDG